MVGSTSQTEDILITGQKDALSSARGGQQYLPHVRHLLLHFLTSLCSF